MSAAWLVPTASDTALQHAVMRARAKRPAPTFHADISLLTKYGPLPTSERFFFEERDNRVVAFPAEMMEAPDWCHAEGCELEAARGGALCAFHEMEHEEDDLIARERTIPLREASTGSRVWDGFAQGRVIGGRVQESHAIFRSTFIPPAPRGHVARLIKPRRRRAWPVVVALDAGWTVRGPKGDLSDMTRARESAQQYRDKLMAGSYAARRRKSKHGPTLDTLLREGKAVVTVPPEDDVGLYVKRLRSMLYLSGQTCHWKWSLAHEKRVVTVAAIGVFEGA